ncbi:hypothetical protein SAMN06295987_102372 [Novosphingobium mathurense]|uniref:Uncharacterized protein n=1 Tax=Novosphingobium mathurense TaxID=428990 RepID=A0A1U6HGT0_9SPHN|nr:hypothetical protein SAMN06295987_102372 [Novosphingobium mathurense]
MFCEALRSRSKYATVLVYSMRFFRLVNNIEDHESELGRLPRARTIDLMLCLEEEKSWTKNQTSVT